MRVDDVRLELLQEGLVGRVLVDCRERERRVVQLNDGKACRELRVLVAVEEGADHELHVRALLQGSAQVDEEPLRSSLPQVGDEEESPQPGPTGFRCHATRTRRRT